MTFEWNMLDIQNVTSFLIRLLMVFILKEKGLQVGNICSYNTHECTINNKTILAKSFLKTHENLFTGIKLWYIIPLHWIVSIYMEISKGAIFLYEW